MRRFLDLVVAGVGLFVCLFFALVLVAVSAHSEAGLLQIFTAFLALIFGAISCAFLLVFSGIRLVFKLAPRRFWGRALIVALVVTLLTLIFAFASGSAQAQLLSLALGIFSVLTLTEFLCAFAVIPARGQEVSKKQLKGERGATSPARLN